MTVGAIRARLEPRFSSAKTRPAQRTIHLGVRVTPQGEHLLQIRLLGFRLDESGLERTRLPIVGINDASVRISAIGVGLLSLGQNPPSELTVKLDDNVVGVLRLVDLEKILEERDIEEELTKLTGPYTNQAYFEQSARDRDAYHRLQPNWETDWQGFSRGNRGMR